MPHYSVTKIVQLCVSRALGEGARGADVRVNAYVPCPTATKSVRTYFESMATQRKRPFTEVVGEFFKSDIPGLLLQKLIDPATHGRAATQLATNPAQNGAAQRGHGGAFHSII